MGIIGNIKSFLECQKNINNFNKLSAKKKRFVFYGESKNDWIYFEGLIEFLLENDQCVSYLTSDESDSSLNKVANGFSSFYIGSGTAQTIFFKNLECENLIMTLPDLGSFHIKRSVFPVNYIYLFHSMVSSHMIYNHKAFDSFDTIMTVGPHQDSEIRENEKLFNLSEKQIIPFGYYRLEKIIQDELTSPLSEDFTVLLAPSWGESSIIEHCFDEVIDELKKANIKTIIRPHPMALKVKELKSKIQAICDVSDNFIFDEDIRSNDSLKKSHVMISDWSGVALEYAFGYERPIIYIDTPKKINNEKFEKFLSVPLEVEIREKIGKVISLNELNTLKKNIDEVSSNYGEFIEAIRKERKTFVYNLGDSSKVGGEYLISLISEGKKSA